MPNWFEKSARKRLSDGGDAKASAQITKILVADRDAKRVKRAHERQLAINGNEEAVCKIKKAKQLALLNKLVRDCRKGRSDYSSTESGQPANSYLLLTTKKSSRAIANLNVYSGAKAIYETTKDCENYKNAFYDGSFGEFKSLGMSVMDGERAIHRIALMSMLELHPDLCRAVPPLTAHPHSDSPLFQTYCRDCPSCTTYRTWCKKYDRILTFDKTELWANNVAFYNSLRTRHPALLVSCDQGAITPTLTFEGYDGAYRKMWLRALADAIPYPIFDMDLGRFVSGFVYINSHSSTAM
jgi:hypothetical protein